MARWDIPSAALYGGIVVAWGLNYVFVRWGLEYAPPISLAAGRAGGEIPARAEVLEPLGNEVLLHWRTPVGAMVSRVPGRPAPAVGENLVLHYAFERMRFFDAGSGAALAADGAP